MLSANGTRLGLPTLTARGVGLVYSGIKDPMSLEAWLKKKGDTVALWPLAVLGFPGAVGMGCRARAGVHALDPSCKAASGRGVP